MESLRQTIRKLILLESSSDEYIDKLLPLLVGDTATIHQAVELGDTLGLIDATSLEINEVGWGDEIEVELVCTGSLAQAIYDHESVSAPTILRNTGAPKGMVYIRYTV